MRNIVYVSDFFWPEVKGGAEMWDRILYENLERQDLLEARVHSDNLKRGHIQEWDDCLFVVSNFAKMTGQQSFLIEGDVDYLIVEHDYKLDDQREPQRYEDYKIPPQHLQNIDFYQEAGVVVVQTSLQKSIFEKNLDDVDYYNFSGSLWDLKDLKFLETCGCSSDQEGVAIVDSDNPIKGTSLAEKYCRENNIQYDLVGSENQEEFWRQLSTYEKLVYLPLTPESFGRTAVEAKMMGLDVVTNQKLGAKFESWFTDDRKAIYREMKDKHHEIQLVLEEYS